jgi:hypothetical protein
MRLSIIVGDHSDAFDARNYDVFLDGEKQTVCLIADEEKGMVRRYKRNAIGMLSKGRNGLIVEDLKGVVVIKRKEGK